jgi:hypothetical protein
LSAGCTSAKKRQAGKVPPERRHHRVEVVRRLLPQLRAGRALVRQRIGRIVELVGEPGARDLARQPRRIVLVVLGMALADVGAGQVDFGAERLQVQDFFDRHLVGHHQHHAVALDARHQRQADAGVARGRLDHHAARLQAAVRLGRGDHRHADPVLDRSARVLRLELEEQLAKAGVDAGDLHQRRVADQ